MQADEQGWGEDGWYDETWPEISGSWVMQVKSKPRFGKFPKIVKSGQAAKLIFPSTRKNNFSELTREEEEEEENLGDLVLVTDEGPDIVIDRSTINESRHNKLEPVKSSGKNKKKKNQNKNNKIINF